MASEIKPVPSFWVIGVLLFVWQAIGAGVYLQQADNGTLNDAPLFVAALLGIAVWSGAAAAALLLLRRRWAAPLFLLSVIAAAIQIAHEISSKAVATPAAWAISLLIIGIGIFATWYAARAARRHWLR